MQKSSGYGTALWISTVSLGLGGCISSLKRPNDESAAKEATDVGAGCGVEQPDHPVARYEATTTTSSVIPMPVALDGDSVVVYYAIDTREAFMQAAVDEDIRALRATCELTLDQAKKARINWIAFVNSHFIDGKPSYLSCTAGVFAEQAFPEAVMQELQPVLANATNPATYGSSTSAELVQLKVQGYTDFPFSHHRVLGTMLRFARTLFAANTHVFHLHIKSHGSAKLALTGLTQQQWTSKDDCQKSLLQAKGLHLPSIPVGNAGLTRTEDGQPQMLGEEGQVFLGEEGQAVLGEEGQAVLGEDGQVVLGTDSKTVLGDEMGLGADTHFGSPINTVVAEVTDFVLDDDETRMGYLILEGCYSGGGAYFMSTALGLGQVLLAKRLSKVYAASGSLWYRNFDWSRLYAQWLAQDAGASSQKLVDLIDQRSAKVTNWKKIP